MVLLRQKKIDMVDPYLKSHQVDPVEDMTMVVSCQEVAAVVMIDREMIAMAAEVTITAEMEKGTMTIDHLVVITIEAVANTKKMIDQTDTEPTHLTMKNQLRIYKIICHR
jgi:hypothetical protein